MEMSINEEVTVKKVAKLYGRKQHLEVLNQSLERRYNINSCKPSKTSKLKRYKLCIKHNKARIDKINITLNEYNIYDNGQELLIVPKGISYDSDSSIDFNENAYDNFNNIL